jgi:hypothetical protein
MAHPLTAGALARRVRDGYGSPSEHQGGQRVLAQPHLSPEVVPRHHHRAAPVAAQPWPAGEQLGLPFEPTPQAQRLEHALGPKPLWRRFRTSREDPTAAPARWRMMEWREGGFRLRRVAALLAIEPYGVYDGQRRFKADGLLGLRTRPWERTWISPRVSVQVMDVFQLLDNHPLRGHDRVKLAFEALGIAMAPRRSGRW